MIPTVSCFLGGYVLLTNSINMYPIQTSPFLSLFTASIVSKNYVNESTSSFPDNGEIRIEALG